MLRACAPIAAALDRAHGSRAHEHALAAAHELLHDPQRTPSARVLQEMKQRYGDSYVDFALAYSLRHREELLSLPLPDESASRLQRMADESLAAQRELEAADNVPFEVYRKQYLTQDLMSAMRLEVPMR